MLTLAAPIFCLIANDGAKLRVLHHGQVDFLHWLIAYIPSYQAMGYRNVQVVTSKIVTALNLR